MLIYSPHLSIAYGYRFSPTKEEIFRCYLRPAINGEPLSSSIVVESEIYGENREPWNIFDKEAKNSFWVFTKLKKKSKSRIDRTAGCGCWLGRNSKEVKNAGGQLLGFEKYFTFSCKKDKSISQNNGNWIMHEFSLNEEGLTDYVVCEIKNKDVVGLGYREDEVEPKNKKRKTLEVNDEEMSVSTIKNDMSVPTIKNDMSVPRMKNVSADDQSNLNENMIYTDKSNASSTPKIDEQKSGQLDQETHNPNRVQTSSLDFANGSFYVSPEELFSEYNEAYLDVDGFLKGLDFDEVISSDFLLVNAEEMSIPSVKKVCVENQVTTDDQGNHDPNKLLQTMISTSSHRGTKANIDQSLGQPHFTDDSFYPGPEVLAREYQASTMNAQENNDPNMLQTSITVSSFQSTEENKDKRLGQPDFADDSFYHGLEELKCESKASTTNYLNNDFLLDVPDHYWNGNDDIDLEELLGSPNLKK
ncbi:hypothetical protein CRYUN_Cryun29cG0014300 [Craigia yunnanensis]